MIKRNKESSYSVFFLIMLPAIFLYLLKPEPIRNIVNSGLNFIIPERPAVEESLKITALLSQIKNLKKENDNLSEFIKKNDRRKGVPAKVKFTGEYIFSDTILIDSGSKAGISEGDPVITEEDIIIGKISETGARWSNVEPLSRVGQKVTLKTGSGKTVLFEGRGIGMEEIYAKLPSAEKIKIGDSVWWGESTNYLVGLVDNVDNRESSDISGITIKNPYSFRGLTNVIVLTKE